ncbi:hypothetical protein [Hydrogenimonas thermophila]|uniref:Uncharacterized protein n=1 Tax=Hydrogenimonas thermophila TaxID=223786 RepID=A0A1I5UME1_9BACT|nr:hypothetical protein [Hydrogenimonas thermophila]SFP96207.1 hypothetical protein SAMN05216234_1656 [Hydrogenimonas thermophila]
MPKLIDEKIDEIMQLKEQVKELKERNTEMMYTIKALAKKNFEAVKKTEDKLSDELIKMNEEQKKVNAVLIKALEDIEQKNNKIDDLNLDLSEALSETDMAKLAKMVYKRISPNIRNTQKSNKKGNNNIVLIGSVLFIVVSLAIIYYIIKH